MFPLILRFTTVTTTVMLKIQFCWILAIRALRKESERLRRGEARHPGKAHLVLPRRLTSGEPQFEALSISC